jgi:hypothetical protein
MNNTPLIFISLDAVLFFEKPFFDGTEWHNLSLNEGEYQVFLSETRSAMLRVPVSMDEEPAAYIYSVYGRGDECYIPVFNRTNMVENEQLYKNEIVSCR